MSLPKGPWREDPGIGEIEDADGDAIAEAYYPDVARAVLALPLLIEAARQTVREWTNHDDSCSDPCCCGLQSYDGIEALTAALKIVDGG